MIEPRQTGVFEGIAAVPAESQQIRVYPGFFIDTTSIQWCNNSQPLFSNV